MSRPWQQKRKYGNRRVEVDGIVFDSKKEADRYQELKLLERAGEITELELQVPYELIPTQRDVEGNVIERKCAYIADFVYRENGELVVEDSKGFETEVFKIKRKLMLHKYGIKVVTT